MAVITEAYRALNAEAHRDPAYGTAAALHAPLVQSVIDATRAESLLDYGAGKQVLRDMVSVAEYRAYDPAIPAIAALPEPADVVYCGDVMEHVEPEFTGAVMADVVRLAKRAAVFVICCEGGRRVLGDGLPAHRNVHPADYWRTKLEAFGVLEEHAGVAKKREVRIVVWPAGRGGEA